MFTGRDTVMKIQCSLMISSEVTFNRTLENVVRPDSGYISLRKQLVHMPETMVSLLGHEVGLTSLQKQNVSE
jgi:hypothetical protein